MGRNGTNKDKKKIEGTDRYEDRNCRRGRQAHQSLKAYWILKYLVNNATEELPVSINELIYELEDKGINTDRKSIYRDIKEINIIDYMLEHEDADVFDAEEAIEADKNGEEKLVLYNKSLKGYYVKRRDYELIDIKLIVQAIQASKFLTEGQVKRLTDIACRVISEGEATKLRSRSYVIDRVRTDNKKLFQNIDIIEQAMATTLDGKPHEPCSIVFDHYMRGIGKEKFLIGRDLLVTPYALVVYDGNYNLVCYHYEGEESFESSKELQIYRVDEMYNVEIVDPVKAEGKAVFETTNLNKLFYQRYHGLREPLTRITLKIHPCLFTDFAETFGLEDVELEYTEDNQILYTGDIAITPFFYCYLAERWGNIKLVDKEQIKGYLDFLNNVSKTSYDEEEYL